MNGFREFLVVFYLLIKFERHIHCYFLFFRVDSLLQIHAIHNLLSIDDTITENERITFQADLAKFEMKYLTKNVNLVQHYLTQQEKWSQKCEEIENKFISNPYQWWNDALTVERRAQVPGAMLRRIQEDVFNNFGSIEPG